MDAVAHRRGSRLQALAIGTACAVAAVPVLSGCGAITDAPGMSTSTSTALPIPGSNALLSADGRTVTVLGAIGGCVVSLHAVAEETASRVTLELDAEVLPRLASCPAPAPTPESVRLRSPLGGRSLVAGDGTPLPVFDQHRLAAATYLPPGFALVSDSPLPPPEYRSGASVGPTPQEPLSWSRRYALSPAASPASLPDVSSPVLTIDQFVGGASVPPGSPDVVAGQADVGGHPATLWSAAPAGPVDAVSWTADGEGFSVAGQAGGFGAPAPTKDDLLRVAAGLR